MGVMKDAAAQPLVDMGEVHWQSQANQPQLQPHGGRILVGRAHLECDMLGIFHRPKCFRAFVLIQKLWHRKRYAAKSKKKKSIARSGKANIDSFLANLLIEQQAAT